MDGFGVICGGCTRWGRVPCDTRMRTRLDRVPARALRPVFRRLFRALQRGKMLKPYAVYGHHYLLSLDGTGFFASGAGRALPVLLERLNLRYLISARENDHAVLFQYLEGPSVDWFADPSEEGRAVDRRLRVVEDVPLSAARSDRRVTVLQCRERTPKRVKKPERQWTWITDLPVTRAEAPATARMARSRWKIENETFNTLKNQGYGLEPNYGHGHQYLANTLATLMLLAFLVDQIQQLCCPRFQAAHRRQSSYASLWEKMRGAIWLLILHSWEQLYEALAGAEPDRSFGRRPDPGFRPP